MKTSENLRVHFVCINIAVVIPLSLGLVGNVQAMTPSLRTSRLTKASHFIAQNSDETFVEGEEESDFSEEGSMDLEPADELMKNTESGSGDTYVEDLPPAEEPVSSAALPAENGSGGSDFDEPDLNYEARLYDIYINFNSAMTSPEQWQVIIGGRETETYTIQGRDTLWGISETMFSDGYFWPKVWSLNSSIPNPHRIEPGMKIHFLPGDDSNPPSMTVTDGEEGADSEEVAESSAEDGDVKGESSEPSENGDSTDEPGQVKPMMAARTRQSQGIDDLDIPPPEKVSRPVMRKFPPSLPEWQNDNILGLYDELGIRFDKKINLIEKTYLQVVNYIAEEVPTDLGEVAEVEIGGLLATDFQYVYLKVKKGGARLGDKMLAIQESEELKRANEFIEKADSYGVAIEVQGVISLVDLVPSEDLSDEYDLFRGLVMKAVNPVSVGSHLIKGDLQTVSLSNKGPSSSVVAQIIGGISNTRRQSFASQSIAFLNRGSKDGLQPGQILPIRTNRRLRYENSLLEANPRPSGWLKIAQVTPHFSTSVILKAFEAINAGDFTGSTPGVKSLGGATADGLISDALENMDNEFSDSSEEADEDSL